ncbi:MAG: methyltransferase domain-containing protein [Acidimicrobiia bacterium]
MSPNAAEWSLGYRSERTPWDMRRPHPELTRRLEADPSLGCESVGRVLVPGCGRGHDALALASAGWDVTAVDIADALEGIARPTLEAAGVRFELGDVFSIDPLAIGGPFDLVFDHTFFCALEPGERPRFGEMADVMLVRKGVVASLVFPLGRPPLEGGPPHGMTPDDISAALGSGFDQLGLGEPFTTGRRSWPHQWASWERR